MTDPLSLTTIATLLYSSIILISAVVNQYKAQYLVPLAAVWLCSAFISGVEFAVFATLYIATTFSLRHSRVKSKWIQIAAWIIWGILTIGLLSHALPGYQGVLLLSEQPVKTNSIATNVYLNTDKVLIAWSLMQWLPIWQPRGQRLCPLPNWIILLLSLPGVMLILGMAWFFGLIAWQPELTVMLVIIVLSNLINTCFTEELIFRGAIQHWTETKVGWLPGLLIASSLFGLVHFAGGYLYTVLATLAGLLYGMIYIVTRRLIWSVLCHWSLNTVHILLLTWPVIKPD